MVLGVREIVDEAVGVPGRFDDGQGLIDPRLLEDRGELAWMNRAMTSLPEPVSP